MKVEIIDWASLRGNRCNRNMREGWLRERWRARCRKLGKFDNVHVQRSCRVKRTLLLVSVGPSRMSRREKQTTPLPPNNLLKYPKFAGGVVYSETHFQLSQTKHCAIIVANFAGCRVGISLTVVVRETNSAR